MNGQPLTGKETWQELRDRAVEKFNAVQKRRGDGVPLRGSHPVSNLDIYLLGEANFLMSLAELERARG